MSSESYGSLLASVVMNKIPQDLRLIVSREIKGGGRLGAGLAIEGVA